MGILSYVWPLWASGAASTTPDARRADDIRTGIAVPSRAERYRCWDSRDGLFACLDRNNIIDAVEPAGAAAAAAVCGPENAQLERDCAAQWASLFGSLLSASVCFSLPF